MLRTKIYRLIKEINRWSFVDPFIVALTAPLMAYPGIADVHHRSGALPFALVVVLTMLASHCFDTRLMWDAAEGKIMTDADAPDRPREPRSRPGTAPGSAPPPVPLGRMVLGDPAGRAGPRGMARH